MTIDDTVVMVYGICHMLPCMNQHIHHLDEHRDVNSKAEGPTCRFDFVSGLTNLI